MAARFWAYAWLPLLACGLVGLIAVTEPAHSEPPDAKAAKEPVADNTVPIATDFDVLEMKLKIGDQDVKVEVQYSRKDNTVFILPVWAIVGAVQRLHEGQSTACKPADLLLPAASKGETRLELKVVNLMRDREFATQIKSQLKEEIAANLGQDKEKYTPQFRTPQIKDDSYLVSLVVEGGSKELPEKMPLSDEVNLPRDATFVLVLDAEAVARWQEIRKKKLTLADAKLRVTGSMKVQFEKLQFRGKITLLENTLDAVRKQITSTGPQGSQAPEVFVELPQGGDVKATGILSSQLRQSLQITIETAKDASAGQMYDLLQSSLNGLIKQQELNSLDDKKRVAILLDKQVAITATVGEIKSLAKMTAQERETKLKEAHDHWDATRTGKASNYNGALSVSYFGTGGKVEGAYGNSSKEETEQRRKNEIEAEQRGLDQLAKHFDGKLPTLSGISFDQKDFDQRRTIIENEIKSSIAEPGYALHHWPLVSLAGQLDAKISPDMLFQQYALMKADYDQLAKVLGGADKIAEAKATIERLETLTAELEKQKKEFAAAQAKFEKDAQDALAKVDQSAVAKLQKDLRRLKAGVNLSYASTAAAFANLEDDEMPPRLDCTGPNGVDAKVAQAAQKAWAKYHKVEPEKTVEIAKGVKMTFALVPPGKYLRGSNGSDDEKPVREIIITKAFYVGKTTVTQSQYAAVMSDNPSGFKKTGDDLEVYPVVKVRATEADDFAKKAGTFTSRDLRLLTEAEYEYANRGGTRTKYYNGDDEDKLGDIAWYYDKNSDNKTHPVGKKAANAWGLYDMSGNVWSWCRDGYDGEYYQNSPNTDPECADKKQDARVVRGGSWFDSPGSCRAAFRYRFAPGDRDFIGLRVCFRLD